MKTSPTQSAAWQQDAFWREVVAVLTGGKKLRGEHYLQNLSAESLEQLRSALSAPGTLPDQRKLCPTRVGGRTDGELPPVSLLSEISQAVRQVISLRALKIDDAISETAKERCRELGLDQSVTNAVLRTVGEETLRQRANNLVGPFAISAAQVLLAAEAMRTKGKQEEVKIKLRERAEDRQSKKLKLDVEKFQFDAAKQALAAVKELKTISASKLSDVEKIDAARRALFGELPENQS